MFGHLDSLSKFTSKLIVVESHYLRYFRFSNEEIDPKIGIYAKNWVRQVLFENFDSWSKFVQKLTFRNLDSLHNLRVLNEETDSRIGMYAKN